MEEGHTPQWPKEKGLFDLFLCLSNMFIYLRKNKIQSLMKIPTTGLRSFFLLVLLDLKHRECRCCDGEKRMFETELSQYLDYLCSPNI